MKENIVLKEWTLAGLMALNLSYTPVEGLTQHADSSEYLRLAYNNPIVNHRPMGSFPETEGFDTPKEPIPYQEFWADTSGQTAQQLVAICSLLAEEADIHCEILSLEPVVKE